VSSLKSKSHKGEAGFQLRFLPGEFGNVSKKLAVFRDLTLAERGKVAVIGGVADKKRTADNVRASRLLGGIPFILPSSLQTATQPLGKLMHSIRPPTSACRLARSF